ncbi:hypothetical protein [Rhizobium sp. L1K21]|uniref:hypothetical protein n=1 Tax=Rhizobium sp. L1K21 TaxID=2954933 RepID=UPI002093B18F|nr:hypothetical protein [Rhizobium sp. L1K21]MCO6187293.1 hypothetical protein [Rhizobium sp. L1K21]
MLFGKGANIDIAPLKRYLSKSRLKGVLVAARLTCSVDWMRVLFRFLSAMMLSFAVVAGVIDTIQSFASSDVILTPALAVWISVNPNSFNAAESTVEGLDPAGRAAEVFNWTLAQPAFAVFLAVALLLWMIGYQRVKPAGRFAA